VARGAVVEAKDNHGWTALMYAAENGHVDCVRVLLNAGADMEAKSTDGGTALMSAAEEACCWKRAPRTRRRRKTT
jgi:ankyrin repeat protein